MAFYTHAYMIPTDKDWVFRGKQSQTELGENHPDVSRIHVAARHTSTPSTAGFDVVKVTITGKNQEAVNDCYLEGKQKIYASINYDAEKAEKKKHYKQKQADHRHHEAVQALHDKNAPPKPKTVEYKKGDSLIMKKFEDAHKANGHGKIIIPAVVSLPNPPSVIGKNAFMDLTIEDNSDDEQAEAQSAKNIQKMGRFVQPTKKTTAPKLSGWAAMAAKAPSVQTPTAISQIGGWDADW